MPFFAWQCLTIETVRRSTDFVIEDEYSMFLLISYLIHQLETIDGQAKSIHRLNKGKLTEEEKSIVY